MDDNSPKKTDEKDVAKLVIEGRYLYPYIPEGVYAELSAAMSSEAKLRSVGIKRAKTRVEAAHNSIGLPGGWCSRTELILLLEDYRTKRQQLTSITAVQEKKVLKSPRIEQLLAIKGVGIVTAAGFQSETGVISRFTSPKQIQKLAEWEIKETSSCKHKGRPVLANEGENV